MRLINVETQKLEEFPDHNIPKYAILSHTWGDDWEELTLRDVQEGRVHKPGIGSVKFQGCCEQAKADHLKYAWMDTCCTDQTNQVELSEAINSMFRWYGRAEICYAYLADVPHGERPQSQGSKFRASRWFRRGWTLQELLAPKHLRFYDNKWKPLGTKGKMRKAIEEITGIPYQFVMGIADLQTASVAQRMSWAAHRETKKVEDIAYCLLGLFGVTMGMIYGEREMAFFRLQEEIMKRTRDDSILAWGLDVNGQATNNKLDQGQQVTAGRILAANPSAFANSGHIVSRRQRAMSPTSLQISGGSLRINLSLLPTSAGKTIGLLSCGPENDPQQAVGIPLAGMTSESADQYIRPSGGQATLVPTSSLDAASYKFIYIKNNLQDSSKSTSENHYWLYDEAEFTQLNLDLVDVAPQSCWREEESLIVSTLASDREATHRIIARLRHNEGGSQDFLVLLEFQKQGTRAREAQCCVMICHRNTTSEELARQLQYLAQQASGRTSASNGLLHLRLILDTQGQPTSIIRPEDRRHPPDTTIDATEELEKSYAAMPIFEVTRSGLLIQSRLDTYLKNDANILEKQAPDSGQTPLAIAVVEGLPQSVDILLNSGAKADSLSRNGETPLLLAAWKTSSNVRSRIIQLLLEKTPPHSIDTTCSAADNKTPLMYAVEKRDIDSIRLLTDAGAALLVKQPDGLNTTYVAEHVNDSAVLRALFKTQPSGQVQQPTFLESFLLSITTWIMAQIVAFLHLVLLQASKLKYKLNQTTNQVEHSIGMEEAKLVKHIDAILKEDPVLAHFFNHKENFIKDLAQQASHLTSDPTTSLGDEDVLPKMVKVSLHQQVIYCDDSSSMKRENRWDSQKQLIQRITLLTTRILPNGEGVALRFINRDIDTASDLRFEDISAVTEPMTWQPGGDTRIGTSLKRKILEPLVYHKIETKSLERPLLISIMTDGMPEPEDKSTLVNSILECGDKLQAAGYPRESVKFLIAQIGTANAATRFLESLRQNPDIAPIVYVSADRLDTRLAEFRGNDRELDRWLIETLSSASSLAL